jgi:hypothetical protein
LANTHASTWDVVFNDPDDHDAGYWETQSRNHWWDPTNTTFPNFTRYLTWVAELQVKTGRQQVAWQVPIGNQYFLTMNNTCGHYQDNVAQYFIAHPSDLFAAGIVAVLFGKANGGQTTYIDFGDHDCFPSHPVGDGVTNNSGVPTSDVWGWCTACNTHTSVWADDDGGYLRIFVAQYYGTRLPASQSGGNPAGDRGVNQSASVPTSLPRTAVAPPKTSGAPAPGTQVAPPAASPPLPPAAPITEPDLAALWQIISRSARI